MLTVKKVKPSTNPLKDILTAAGRFAGYTNRSFYCKGVNAALATGLVKIEICENEKVWFIGEKKYNLKVSGGGYVRRVYIRGIMTPGEILREIGALLQDENVKKNISADVYLRPKDCQKCSGVGIIPKFYYYCSGICFDCGGTGINFSNDKTTVIISTLTPAEQTIIDLLRQARPNFTSAYDVIIHGNDSNKHRQLLAELSWQIMNGPGEDMVNTYGEQAVIKLSLLKIQTPA